MSSKLKNLKMNLIKVTTKQFSGQGRELMNLEDRHSPLKPQEISKIQDIKYRPNKILTHSKIHFNNFKSLCKT